tara:strand:+ start:132 stop:404 length:273 start_codon:yes stop_codon:yes gene_type:complete
MALEKQTLVGSIGVNENGTINVRTDTVILDDGVEASRAHSRKVLAPGEPLDGEDARVVSVANAVWTDEVVAAYQASLPAEPAAEESEGGE